jgi:hypothetical protein
VSKEVETLLALLVAMVESRVLFFNLKGGNAPNADEILPLPATQH